ncbi:MAG TPA: tetratricopeptide repeat protein [bacterium]|nr:tetratricopeptide repeat protein [bacterium]
MRGAEKLFYSALGFILFLVPLVYSGSSYHFIYIKEAVFAAGVIFLGAVFLFERSINIKRASLFPLVLGAWMLISFIFSDYKHAALIVSLRYGSVFLFFFILANYEKYDRRKARVIFAAGAVLPLLIGVLQAVVPGFMKELMVFGNRIPSTFGNPNFLAAFAVCVIPVVLGLAGGAGKRLKAAYYAEALLAAACVVLSGSKAGFIVLVVMAAVYGAVYGSRYIGTKKAAAAAAVIILLGAVGTAAMSGMFAPDGIMKNDSVFFRLHTWKGALQMTAQKPLTGTGPGAFALEYPAHRPDEIMKWSAEHSYETLYAENFLIHAAAERGIPGMLILMWMMYVFFTARSRGSGDLKAALGALLCVNLAGVDINYMPSFMAAFFMAGLVINGQKKEAVISISGPGKRLLAAGIVTAAVFIFYTQFMMNISFIHLKKGEFLSRAGNYKAAISEYEKTLAIDPCSLSGLYFMAGSYYDLDREANRQKALEVYERLEKLAPNYVLLHYMKGAIYRAAEEYDRAADSFSRMLALDPYYKPAAEALAYIYLHVKSRPKEAAAPLIKLLEKFPGDASIYNNLGNIYFMEKRLKDSIEAFKKAIDLKADKDYYYNLGCVYFTANDGKNARYYLEKADKAGKGSDPRVKQMLSILERYDEVTGVKHRN